MPRARDVTGVPAASKNKAYWVGAALIGSAAGAAGWYFLTRTDPLGKLKILKDHGPSALRGVA